MCTVHFWEAICFTFIHIVLCFSQHTNSSQADDVIKHCVNFTNWPSCSYAYRQVYESLTKPENSFNISHALYPGRAKPSFLVKVNVYGPDKTTFPSPAMYTWSISCLYATVPGLLLEILSLGSILVTSRTQELNIQIPPFCCNISDDNWTREEIIGGFLTRALTELQDLAVSPGIRDPSLNTAECVMQDHKPNFESTGRTANIRVMLWLLPIFVVFSGPLFALYVIELWDQKHNEQTKKNRAKAICTSFYVLSVLGNVLLLVAFILSLVKWIQGQATFDIPLSLTIMILWDVIESCFFLIKCAPPIAKECCAVALCGANTISYLFCWLIIGIRINPTWGLTIALIVLSLSAALTYAMYIIREATHITSDTPNSDTPDDGNGSDNIDLKQVIFFCVSGCLAVLLLFVIVVLAGPSYSGKETEVEVLKTISLYFITTFISWVTWKKHASNQQSGENDQNNSRQNSEEFKLIPRDNL